MTASDAPRATETAERPYPPRPPLGAYVGALWAFSMGGWPILGHDGPGYPADLVIHYAGGVAVYVLVRLCARDYFRSTAPPA